MDPLDAVGLRVLLDRYCLLTDRQNFTHVAELFCSDGSFTSSYAPPAVGRDAIARTLRSSLTRFAEVAGLGPEGLLTQHTALGLVYEIEGDTATGTVQGQARLTADGAAEALLNVLRYEDEYRRLDGCWYFRSRRVVRLWTERAEAPGDARPAREPGRPRSRDLGPRSPIVPVDVTISSSTSTDTATSTTTDRDGNRSTDP